MHSPSVFLAILFLLPKVIQCHHKWKPSIFLPFSHSTWQCFCVLLLCLFSLNVWFYTIDMQSAQMCNFVCCFTLSCYSIITQENFYFPKCMWPWITSQLFVRSVSSRRLIITPTPWVTGSVWMVSSHHTKNLHLILGRIEQWELRRRAGAWLVHRNGGSLAHPGTKGTEHETAPVTGQRKREIMENHHISFQSPKIL